MIHTIYIFLLCYGFVYAADSSYILGQTIDESNITEKFNPETPVGDLIAYNEGVNKWAVVRLDQVKSSMYIIRTADDRGYVLTAYALRNIQKTD